MSVCEAYCNRCLSVIALSHPARDEEFCRHCIELIDLEYKLGELEVAYDARGHQIAALEGKLTETWNLALEAAEVAVIAAPSALKTTNNVPDYYMERGVVIEAIRSKLRVKV